MKREMEMPRIGVWQAEFWFRREAVSNWIDFPRHESETLESGRENGCSLVCHLRTGELEEKEEDWTLPAWKRARREEEAVKGDSTGDDDATRYVQTNISSR